MEHGEEKSDSNMDDLISKVRHIKNLMGATNLTSEKSVDIKGTGLSCFQYFIYRIK